MPFSSAQIHAINTNLIYISQPLDNVLEALLICYVVHQHYAHCSSVVGRCDCVESLLASCKKHSKGTQ